MFNSTRTLINDFQNDTRGAIAIIFGFTFLVMIVAIGSAIDIGRGIRVSTTIASAVDAAVLAGAKGLRLKNMSDAEIKTLVTTIFDENVKASGVDTPTINSFNVIINRAKSSVELDVNAEIPTVIGQLAGVDRLSTPSRGVAVYEAQDIEVALQLDVTGSMGGSKIADLKDATKLLVDILIPDDKSLLQGQKIRIGYAPYAAGINAGTYASKMNGNVSAPNNCVYERSNTAHQNTDSYPVGGTVLKTKLDLPSANNCPTAELLPMTDDKVLLKTTVDSYWTGGTTAGHLGTSFSWYLLSPNWASIWPAASQPADYSDTGTKKIAILMTDGQYNTVGGSYSGANVTASQDFATSTCAGMKAAGIKVYTVGFKLNVASATSTLQACASSMDHFYEAEDGDALKLAFAAIAEDIATLRLSE